MLLRPRYVARFRDVAAVLARHGWEDLILALDLQRFLPGHPHDRSTPAQIQQARARGLRLALEELGATYIKLGQLLSTRPDIVPLAYLSELEHLQDRVEPEDAATVREHVARELGRPLTELFARFDDTPVACASLSQVHRAVLAPGIAPQVPFRDVAVKVLRPGVERETEVDLEILTEVARFARLSELGRRYDLEAVAEQLRHTLLDELDLRREARNTRHFRRVLAGYPRLRVPQVVEEVCASRVCLYEFVDGRRLASLEEGTAPPGLAEELWRAYLEQILVGGLFQCDPHPGNFLLDAEERIVLLDHGMVAHLSRDTQFQLMTLLLALVDRDGEAAAEACLEIGIPGPEFRERQFKADVGMLVARHAGLGLAEMELGRLLLRLVRTGFKSDIKIPSELMLLGKTVLSLEGVCRRLEPGLDPVSTMQRVATTILRQQLGRELTRERAMAASLEARSLLAQVPASLRRILRRAASNELRIGLRVEGVEETQVSIQKIASRVSLSLITAALIIGSAMLLNVPAGYRVWGYPVFALVGFLLAAGLGIYLVVRIILFDRY